MHQRKLKNMGTLLPNQTKPWPLEKRFCVYVKELHVEEENLGGHFIRILTFGRPSSYEQYPLCFFGSSWQEVLNEYKTDEAATRGILQAKVVLLDLRPDLPFTPKPRSSAQLLRDFLEELMCDGL